MSDGTPYNIIVKPYLSYDGGVPVGGHAKVASQTEDGVAHVSYIRTHILTFTTICMGCSAHPRGAASAGFCHSNHEKLRLNTTLTLKNF